ncbi:MAG TPA: hypothetical protein VGG25_02185 [Streptosporangiaceae bacterium]|jgi:hypothetical protein
MQDTRYSLAPLWDEIRAEFRAIRDERATRKALRRDLGHAASADLAELDAILQRYEVAQTEALREVLAARKVPDRRRLASRSS